MTTGIIDLPQFTWRPLGLTQPEILPSALIAHTAVSGADSLWGFFRSGASSGVEAHAYIRADGTAEQYVAATMMADANGTANRWWDPVAGAFRGAFSVETWDGGNPATPWTLPQLNTLADVAVWLNQRFGVPLTLCPTPQSPGLGWHALHPSWSPAHHTCPGPVRITQFTAQLVPLIQRKVMQPAMACQPTLTEIETYVAKSYQAAANTDARGERYWVRTAGGSDTPFKVFTEMDHALGLA